MEFVDSIIRTDLPHLVDEADLHEFVSKYQIHRHSRTCRKYKNIPCHFNFGKYFSKETIIAEPLPEDMDNSEKLTLLPRRTEILKKVKSYINEYLDPCKPSFVENIKITEILNTLEIIEEHYYKALSISATQDFEIHYRRPPNSCFVNNYFDIGLLSWQANIDIQPIFNYYKPCLVCALIFLKRKQNHDLL